MCTSLSFTVSGAGVACEVGWGSEALTKCVCETENDIGAAGGTAVAEALKVNTGVQKIDLYCQW